MVRTAGEGARMWRDFTPLPRPLIKPNEHSKRILIVGGGVTGLVTAWLLLDQGYKVTIISKEWASFGKEHRLTSQIAGALWEWPPAVCGSHTDKISLQSSKRWCMVAYRAWQALASNEDLSKNSGVRMAESDFFFPYRLEKNPTEREKMNEIKNSGVKGFKRGPQLIAENAINPSSDAVDGYGITVPVIDTDQSMDWLMRLVQSKGAQMRTEEITADLLDLEHQLMERFDADVIINCTGLAATQLAGDETCYPLRGALIRVINDGKDFPKVKNALSISANATASGEIVFIVPRNDDILLLGGIAQSNQQKLDLTLEAPVVQRMMKRCEDFLPALKHARIDPEYPLAQGLRPVRKQNVRVERELRPSRAGGSPSRIIHSYGQGGSGWSLSFGCASDVLGLVEEALSDLRPRPMQMEAESIAPYRAML